MGGALKPEPFIAPGSTEKATKDEMERLILRINRAKEIGEDFTRLDSSIDSGYENPYRVEALCHILADQEVPEHLKDKIRELDEKHSRNR